MNYEKIRRRGGGRLPPRGATIFKQVPLKGEGSIVKDRPKPGQRKKKKKSERWGGEGERNSTDLRIIFLRKKKGRTSHPGRKLNREGRKADTLGEKRSGPTPEKGGGPNYSVKSEKKGAEPRKGKKPLLERNFLGVKSKKGKKRGARQGARRRGRRGKSSQPQKKKERKKKRSPTPSEKNPTTLDSRKKERTRRIREKGKAARSAAQGKRSPLSPSSGKKKKDFGHPGGSE